MPRRPLHRALPVAGSRRLRVRVASVDRQRYSRGARSRRVGRPGRPAHSTDDTRSSTRRRALHCRCGAGVRRRGHVAGRQADVSGAGGRSLASVLRHVPRLRSDATASLCCVALWTARVCCSRSPGSRHRQRRSSWTALETGLLLCFTLHCRLSSVVLPTFGVLGEPYAPQMILKLYFEDFFDSEATISDVRERPSVAKFLDPLYATTV